MVYPLTYVVIINWNGKAILHKCLLTFFANTKSDNCRVILVDNGSTDGSVEMLQKDFPQIQLIKNNSNKGFSAANNQGIRVALANGAEQVLLLNNDIEITDSQWLEKLTTVLESDPQIGVAGCKLLFGDGRIQHAGGVITLRGASHRGEREVDGGQFDRVEFVDYVTGAVLLIKAKVIREIGLLDEGYSPIYCEDSDWCVRARLRGYKIIYTPKPTLIHHCGVDTAKMGSKKAFIFRKSAIRFFLLNYQTKDILKRLVRFEFPSVIACFIGRNRKGGFPLVLRSDASKRLAFLVGTWSPSIRDLRGILAKRQQRFQYKRKLQLSN
ncbi:MAG: glycosyltransferase family 2 protein [Candidatus Bathyarchaeota archaeon]|nr:glycosyltransferase family 2 protein [Candidatus Bathyarchaeota archaeon]